MEDILEVYRRPLDAKRPLVCMDELPYQLLSETHTPLLPQPGQTQCCDYAYKREGVINIFMVFARLLGQRWTRITKRRSSKDWAYLVRDIMDVVFSDAKQVVLVIDNLNTHGGALYEAFPPEKARRILNKLEIHYTPQHGSWLNAEKSLIKTINSFCLLEIIATGEVLAIMNKKYLPV